MNNWFNFKGTTNGTYFMISRNRMDKLTGALMLDRVFRESFLQDRALAITNYNSSFARRFSERPLDLNDEEMNLILSLSADSINAFVVALEQALSDLGLTLIHAEQIRRRFG